MHEQIEGNRQAPAAPAAVPAKTTLVAQLARGAVGFGLLGCALLLTPRIGPAALLLVLPGMVALGGCPTCWLLGLIEVLSAGRLERSCERTDCTLQRLP